MTPSTPADRNAGPLSMEQRVFNDLFNIEPYLQEYELHVEHQDVADPEFVNWATQKFHPHVFAASPARGQDGDGTNLLFFLTLA